MKPREIPYKQHEELPGSSRFGIEKKGNQEKEKNRERKALTARLLSVLELSEEQIGPLGREYTQEFVEGRISKEDLAEKIESAPDFSDFQEKGLQFLEALGVVEREQDV
jgi:hypothetical protein